MTTRGTSETMTQIYARIVAVRLEAPMPPASCGAANGPINTILTGGDVVARRRVVRQVAVVKRGLLATEVQLEARKRVVEAQESLHRFRDLISLCHGLGEEAFGKPRETGHLVIPVNCIR